MDKDKRIEVERWFLKADNDLRAGHASLQATPPITDDVCFHSQQTIEKSLKAYLVFLNKKFEKTHDLFKLLNACKEHDISFEELKPLLFGMASYATAERYPDDWREIPLDEAREAIGKAEKVMAFVKGKIKL